MSDVIRAVDLFCGAGGLSWGLVEALKGVAIEADHPTEAVLEDVIDLVGVNHWDIAIQTHERNHPWARHFHDDVSNVAPQEVFDGDNPEVMILSGGIECTHWSIARGGKPVDEQKRMPAWDVLTWIQKLRPQNVLLENVKEFEKWGKIDEDGRPTRSGEVFEQWVNSIHALGYSVDWRVLNAADYGDATSRERLFVVARRDHRPEFPDATHSESGEKDTEPWRTAAEIIDWSEPGESIWSRSRPLVQNTMERIAEGIRRHGDDKLQPFAEIVGNLEKSDVESLQERVVPAGYAALVAELLDEPFLVANDGGRASSLCSPFLLGQHGGATARDVDDGPVPTIATDGYVRLFDVTPFVLPRNGRGGGLHSNAPYEPGERPLHTVTAKNTDGHLVSPSLLRFSHGGALLGVDNPLPTITTARGGVFAISQPYLIQYHGQSGSHPVDVPVPTLTTKDSLALCVPDHYPWGLDIKFRMLQPRELAAAQGFPEEYEFAGTKTETVEQIGNAVPVNLAQRLVESLLESSRPALTDYLNVDVSVAEDSDTPTRGVAGDD